MYIPVDPNSIEGMWAKLLQSLCSQKSCMVVSDGQPNDKQTECLFGEEEANEMLTNLKSRDYIRVGSSRMSPIPVHFAINIVDNVGRLMELITLSSDENRLRNDVSLVCQFSFFENKEMKELIIPFVIKGLEDPELRFETDDNTGTTMAYRM